MRLEGRAAPCTGGQGPDSLAKEYRLYPEGSH